MPDYFLGFTSCYQKSFLLGGLWYGIDILSEDIADNFEAFVWEPAIVRLNALTAASEAACLILSVDETVQNPKSDVSGNDNPITGKRGRTAQG